MADRPTTAELVAAERAAQGLPRYVEDPGALERIATLLVLRGPVQPRITERPAKLEGGPSFSTVEAAEATKGRQANVVWWEVPRGRRG